jgi:hypothetical protein
MTPVQLAYLYKLIGEGHVLEKDLERLNLSIPIVNGISSQLPPALADAQDALKQAQDHLRQALEAMEEVSE